MTKSAFCKDFSTTKYERFLPTVDNIIVIGIQYDQDHWRRELKMTEKIETTEKTSKQWKRDPLKWRKYMRQYRQDNKERDAEKVRQYSNEYYHQHPEYRKAYSRDYQKRHQDTMNKRSAQWRAKHPEMRQYTVSKSSFKLFLYPSDARWKIMSQDQKQWQSDRQNLRKQAQVVLNALQKDIPSAELTLPAFADSRQYSSDVMQKYNKFFRMAVTFIDPQRVEKYRQLCPERYQQDLADLLAEG